MVIAISRLLSRDLAYVQAELDQVTSTGFAPSGYTVADLKLMRRHTPAHS
jgi:deoxyribose-phosphate aldolase